MLGELKGFCISLSHKNVEVISNYMLRVNKCRVTMRVLRVFLVAVSFGSSLVASQDQGKLTRILTQNTINLDSATHCLI